MLPIQLTPALTVSLSWSVKTIAFVHKWQQRSRSLELLGESKDYLAEAASVVLGAVEQLDESMIQILEDLYRLSGQLPALGDRLLVDPLELYVEDRQFEVTYSGGHEQVHITYCFEIKRYRYETLPPVPGLVSDSALNTAAV